MRRMTDAPRGRKAVTAAVPVGARVPDADQRRERVSPNGARRIRPRRCDDRYRRMLEEAEKSCARLTTLVAEMSDLSALEAGTAVLQEGRRSTSVRCWPMRSPRCRLWPIGRLTCELTEGDSRDCRGGRASPENGGHVNSAWSSPRNRERRQAGSHGMPWVVFGKTRVLDRDRRRAKYRSGQLRQGRSADHVR